MEKKLTNALRHSWNGTYNFVGAHLKLTSEMIVGDDYVHPRSFGGSQLRSIVVTKNLREFKLIRPSVTLNNVMLRK